MAAVEPPPRQLGDHLGRPLAGPQIRAEAVSLRPGQHGLAHARQLGRTQGGGPPRPPVAQRPRGGVPPAAHRLRGNAQPPRHLGGRQAVSQQLFAPQAALLQPREIALLSFGKAHILFDGLPPNNVHFILQQSVVAPALRFCKYTQGNDLNEFH